MVTYALVIQDGLTLRQRIMTGVTGPETAGAHRQIPREDNIMHLLAPPTQMFSFSQVSSCSSFSMGKNGTLLESERSHRDAQGNEETTVVKRRGMYICDHFYEPIFFCFKICYV